MMGRTATIFADSSRYASHLRVARLGRVAGIEELVLTQQEPLCVTPEGCSAWQSRWHRGTSVDPASPFLTVTSEQALRLTGGRR